MTAATKTKHLATASRAITGLMLGATLSACTSLGDIEPHSDTEVADTPSYGPYSYRVVELSKLAQWDVEGKMAVYTTEKNNSGNLTWRQRKDYFELLITGPLGQGHLHIEGSQGLVIATTPKEQAQANSVEQLFTEHFDWQFPMQEIRYWVRGIASPEHDAKLTYNESGELASVEQAGWLVAFTRYTQVSGLPMPNKITITGNDIKLKLVLKNWANLYPFPRLNISVAN